MEQSFLKTKMMPNQVRNIVDVNVLSQRLNFQSHLQKLSQKASKNTWRFQMECQLKKQGNVQDDENDYIAESRSTFRAFAERTSNTKLPRSKVIHCTKNEVFH